LPVVGVSLRGDQQWPYAALGRASSSVAGDLSGRTLSGDHEADTVRFNLINPQTNNRIRMKTVDAGTGEEVNRGDLVKGFAVAKNQYVLLDKDDFARWKLESTRVIDIEEFVPASSIDRLYWTRLIISCLEQDRPSKLRVIRTAMMKKDMVAIGRLVMSTRETDLRPGAHGDGVVLTLAYRRRGPVRDEIDIPICRSRIRMLDIAEKIVEQQTGDFDPSHFNDRYEEALRALIEEKKKGKPIAPSRPRTIPRAAWSISWTRCGAAWAARAVRRRSAPRSSSKGRPPRRSLPASLAGRRRASLGGGDPGGVPQL